ESRRGPGNGIPRSRRVYGAAARHYRTSLTNKMWARVADQSVVSVVSIEIAETKESEFLSLTGQMQSMVRRKGYGTNQLLRDGSHPRRYYEIRIWRTAESAAHAEADSDVEDLRREIGKR